MRVKQKAKFFYPANYVTFLSFEFFSVMQLKNYIGTSQLSDVKLTLTLYFAQCISFSRLKKVLKGLSHEIDFKNFNKNLQNLA
jgi:hypothetical protein